MESLFAITMDPPRRRRNPPPKVLVPPVSGNNMDSPRSTRARPRPASDILGQMVFEFMADTKVGLVELSEMHRSDMHPQHQHETSPVEGTEPARQSGISGQSTYDMVRRIKLTQLLAAGLTIICGGVFLVATLTRLLSPTPYGGRMGVAVATVWGIIMFLGSLAGSHWLGPRERDTRPFAKAVSDYCRGSIAGVILNLLSLPALSWAIVSDGFAGGLWIPLLTVAGLNIFGLWLCWPRLRMLRALHHGPSLPYVR